MRSSRLCNHHSQVAGVGISGGRDSAVDPALSDAAAQSDLHWDHARQTPGGTGGAKKSIGDCGQEFPRRAPVVKTEAMAVWQNRARDALAFRAAIRIERLNHFWV